MVPNLPEWKRIHRVFQRGLTLVEYADLVVIGFATTNAMVPVRAGAGVVRIGYSERSACRSMSLLSFTNRNPTMTVISATTTGYHRPK